MENTQLTPKVSFFQKVLSRFTKRTEQEVIKNHVHAKKIRNFQETDFQELVKNLKLISFAHFGIQAPVTDFAMLAITDMLQDYYADLSAEEVYSAFKACAAGEYMDGKDVLKPYGAFSVQFVGQVLNNYSRNKIQVLKKAEQIKGIAESKEPKNYVSNEQVYNSLVSWVKWQKKIPIIWLWDAAFQHLVCNGKAQEHEKQTYEQKQGVVINHLKELFPELKQSLTV